MRLGEVPTASYAPPGSAELSNGVAELSSSYRVMLLANHGSVVAGETLSAAIDLAEELETAAQITFLLRGERAAELSSAEIRRLP